MELERPPKAEKCGLFIQYVLDELNCNVDIYDEEKIEEKEDLKKFPGHYGGLYLFYMKPSPESDLRYPVYVGITKQSFKDRFERHANTGVIRKMWGGEFPKCVPGLGLYAYCTHYQGASARRIKSVLLNTFNFALREGRDSIDTSQQYPAEWTNRNLDDFPWDELKALVDEQEKEDKKKELILAEKGGAFIRFLLDELNCNVDLYDKEEITGVEDLNKFPAHYGGLYLFYMKPDSESDLRYPIYVGVTKQSFRERFERQAEDRFNAVLHNLMGGKYSGLGVYAICTHYKGPAARTIKRFLLNNFNFALKRNRRGGMRDELETGDQLPVEYVKDNYNIPWEEFVEKVKAMG